MTSTREEMFHRRQYRNPPIVEAVARLQFANPLPWSLTTPGLMYAAVKEHYPAEPKIQNVMAAELSAEEGASTNLQIKSGPQKIRFETEAADRLLIVGAEDISAHSLGQYEGWESLAARLVDGLDLLGELAPERQFSAMGVRYINRIEIPENSFRFEDYLTIGFVGPPGFPPNVNAFFDRMESLYEDGRSRIAFTWTTVEAEPGFSAFVLDFDLNWSLPEGESVGMDEAIRELNRLKSKETAAFESLLRDKLRGMFDEVND